MQKSLELFLGTYLSSSKQCHILLRDEPCMDNEKCFYISSSSDADLVKPFSKAQLLLALENRYKTMRNNISSDDTLEVKNEPLSKNPLNFEILEKRIESLTLEYQANILQAVKAFYEK